MKFTFGPVTALFLGMLGLTGCEPEVASPQSPAPYVAGVLFLGDQTYPFRVTSCIPGGPQTPRLFTLLGHGVTKDGQTFEIQADGALRRVEMRMKAPDGPLIIYASAVDPANLTIRNGHISAQGVFMRVSEGGELKGHLQADCE